MRASMGVCGTVKQPLRHPCCLPVVLVTAAFRQRLEPVLSHRSERTLTPTQPNLIISLMKKNVAQGEEDT